MKHNPKDNLIRRQPRSNLLVTALIVGLVIVFTFMLTDYFKQHRVQNSLRSQIETKRQELISAPAPSADLRQQLEKAESANQAARAALSAEAVNSTEIIAALLETAGDCGLTSSNLTTEKWSSKSIGESTYRLMPVNLDLKGTVSALRLFMQKLENRSAFPALAVENLSIAGPGEKDDSGKEQDLDPQITAKLTAAVLTKIETIEEEY